MLRKLVKHGPSSFIVSLPLKWIKSHNLNKGDEVNVEENSEDVIISTTHKDVFEYAEFNVDDTKETTCQIICALYKRGVDEIKIHFSNPEDFKIIMHAVMQEGVGYEIVESNESSCRIKSITKLTKEFDTVLRRVFLVTLSLAEEGVKAIQERNYDALDNIMFLEKSNNKLTAFCQRYINLYSAEEYDRIGPIYFIIELLEKIADQYCYLYEDQKKLNPAKSNKELLSCYIRLNRMLRLFYQCFYKYDDLKIREIKEERDFLMKFLDLEFPKIKTQPDICLFHHALNLVEKIFALVDPLLVLNKRT